MRNFLFILIFLTAVPAFAHGPKKLVLFGGGDRAFGALKQYAEWAGGADAKVLIIGWSSEQPEVYFQTISDDLRKQGVTEFIPSLTGPASASRNDVTAFTRDFEKKLSQSTAVFFTGGNQLNHMKVINLRGIRSMLEEKYAAGTVFAGTSAGTAIMSKWMLTGKNADVKRGLGLLPDGIIVDQHGRRPGRELRIETAMGENEILEGILIDEDNGITLFNEKKIKAYGPTWVNLYQLDDEGRIHGDVLHELDTVDTTTWHVRRRCVDALFP